jgi:hypothetical protein
LPPATNESSCTEHLKFLPEGGLLLLYILLLVNRLLLLLSWLRLLVRLLLLLGSGTCWLQHCFCSEAVCKVRQQQLEGPLTVPCSLLVDSPKVQRIQLSAVLGFSLHAYTTSTLVPKIPSGSERTLCRCGA